MKLHHSLKKLQMKVQPNTFCSTVIGCLWMAEQQALKVVILNRVHNPLADYRD